MDSYNTNREDANTWNGKNILCQDTGSGHSLSQIDIGELTEFLHNWKKSKNEASTMLKNSQTALMNTTSALSVKAIVDGGEEEK